MTDISILQSGLHAMQIGLNNEQQSALLAYLKLLYKWNKSFRLTAVSEEKAISHHLLDSLSILPFLIGDNLLDVGSGGGTPGIPLAIAHPQLQVTLLDSNSKKTAFLQQCAILLKLSNVQVICRRVEDFVPAQKFTQITSRAFASLADFTKLTQHLLDENGQWLAMKGVLPEEEIAALPNEIQVKSARALHVPNVDEQRHLLVLSTL